MPGLTGLVVPTAADALAAAMTAHGGSPVDGGEAAGASGGSPSARSVLAAVASFRQAGKWHSVQNAFSQPGSPNGMPLLPTDGGREPGRLANAVEAMMGAIAEDRIARVQSDGSSSAPAARLDDPLGLDQSQTSDASAAAFAEALADGAIVADDGEPTMEDETEQGSFAKDTAVDVASLLVELADTRAEVRLMAFSSWHSAHGIQLLAARGRGVFAGALLGVVTKSWQPSRRHR